MTANPDTSHFRAMHNLVGSAYFPVSALARLPLSMLVMGVLTYVVASSSDFASAGIAAAVTGVGVAVGAPLSGMASDRWGQRPTLLVTTVVYAVAVVAVLVTGTAAGGDVSPSLLAAAGVAGLAVPQCGPMTRVRWIRGLSERGSGSAVAEAQGYEGTIDELGFVLGPAAVGVIASIFGPAAPLYLIVALTAIVVPWFALHRSADFATPLTAVIPTADGEPTTEPAPVPWRLISVLLIGMVGVGTIFGSLATTTAVFADETGHSGSGGLIYAALGLTSGAAALSVSRWSRRLTASARWLACSLVLVPALALLWLPSVPWQMAVVLLLIGAPIGPILVTIFKVAGDRTPARRLGFVMTLLSAGITLGTSVGNWCGGEVAASGGHSASIGVALGAGVAVLACAVVFTVGRLAPGSRPSQLATPEHVLEPLH